MTLWNLDYFFSSPVTFPLAFSPVFLPPPLQLLDATKHYHSQVLSLLQLAISVLYTPFSSSSSIPHCSNVSHYRSWNWRAPLTRVHFINKPDEQKAKKPTRHYPLWFQCCWCGFWYLGQFCTKHFGQLCK